MKRNILFFMILPLITIGGKSFSQTTDNQDEIKVKFSGFVNSQMMYDTRKSVEAREAMLVLYPLAERLDKNGKDLNTQPSFNHLAMISRVKATVTGPDVLKAKMSAVIESDFSGASNIENNSLRLRHAFVKMNWTKQELIVGQYWHPINVPEMLPTLLSLNTGAPFHPFSRHIQARTSREFGKFKLIGVLASQRDFASTGIDGVSSVYMRNAVIPNVHLQVQYKTEKVLAGVGGDFKSLKPRVFSDSLFKNNEVINSYAAVGFINFIGNKIDVKLESILGQNLYEHLMLGGYAERNIDPITAITDYTNVNQVSFWTNISTKREHFNFGVFGGYLKNLGSVQNYLGKAYTRGSDVAYVYRVTPIFSYTEKNFKIMAEMEYTVAAYGTPNTLGDIETSKEYNNFRGLLGVFYNF